MQPADLSTLANPSSILVATPGPMVDLAGAVPQSYDTATWHDVVLANGFDAQFWRDDPNLWS